MKNQEKNNKHILFNILIMRFELRIPKISNNPSMSIFHVIKLVDYHHNQRDSFPKCVQNFPVVGSNPNRKIVGDQSVRK